MSERYATVEELRRGITTEILIAAGLPRTGLHQRLLAPLVWPVAQRFARLASEADRRTAEEGIAEAARWTVLQFVDALRITGAEGIPQEGPLIVASNHPGSYDVLSLTAGIGRRDLKIIVSDVPVLRALTATSPHLIYVPHDPQVRMGAAREGIRHLKAGGALLVMASAQVDPDPEFVPGAARELEKWSESTPLFLRRVPQAKLVVSIVRGVLARSCFYHPLARLRGEQRLQQFTAEFLQIGQQLLFGRRFQLTPTVSFGPPLTVEALGGSRDPEAAMGAILREARKLLGAQEVKTGLSPGGA